MIINLRSLFLGSCALILGCADQSAAPPGTTQEAAQPRAAAAALGATPLAVDARGVPSLLRGGASIPAMSSVSATESARLHLARLAPAWGLRSAAALPALDALGEIKVRGGTVVRFRQVLDGLPVEASAGGELRVMVRADGSLIGASGTLRSNDTPRAGAATFVDDDASAIARAVNDKYSTAVSPRMLSSRRIAADGSRLLAGQDAGVSVAMSRARQAWYPQGKALVPAWIVEAYSSAATSTDADAYRTVISASGKVLARVNLKADAFKYRVFADPASATTDFHPLDGPIVDSSPNTRVPVGFPAVPVQPDFVAPILITVDGNNHPAFSAGPDPWLPAGAVQTQGNNVDAYTDAHAPDGFSNDDFRANITAPGELDRTYDLTKGAMDSTDQQKAGITSLFYLINWMHDFWYDAGFTEAAGNGQNNNYGRGGEERDAVLAEAQDNVLGGSRNNANMATPSDGFPGKMQVFVWDNLDHRKLVVGGVSTLVGTAAFGPTSFNVADQPVALSAGAADATLTTACTPLAAALSGKIVVVDRGACSFAVKTKNAQTAGALGVIVANNAPGPAPGMAGSDATITIPTLSVSQADGVVIKAKIAGGTTATMSRNLEPDLDGTLDITVIGHEFGHFVHHRLSSCDTTLCGAMSEGWADFSALLVSSRDGDDFDKQFPLGIYSTRGTSPDPQYYGIRRAPYTTNHAVNPLTFQDMTKGKALPPPLDTDDPSSNNEVHAAGEVWASMLWEGYVALQKSGTSFADTRTKMQQYVVAGLLLAPVDATPTETRDAVLLAAKTASEDDYNTLLAAYSKRGFGSCAVSPDRSSATFTGIVDSMEIKGRIETAEVATNRTVSCDNDEALDPGEAMQIKIPLANAGDRKLTNVKATLHSDLVDVNGDSPTLALGDVDAGGTTIAAFIVTLKDAVTAPTESDITLELTSDDGCGSVTVPVVAAFDVNDKAASSATDDFNAEQSVWAAKPAAAADASWSHIRASGLDGQWFGEDLPVPTDATLTSPVIHASATDPVTVTFKHAYDFELAPPDSTHPASRAFDGGVIEYSVDAGQTWADISAISDVAYDQALEGTSTTSKNVLAGRPAFAGENAMFPDPDTATINFGTALAGQAFQLRFRIGTDDGGSGAGWLVDDVAFTGITTTPFPTVVADGGAACQGGTPTMNSDDGGCCQAGGMKAGNLLAALGVLGLVLRRRRRR